LVVWVFVLENAFRATINKQKKANMLFFYQKNTRHNGKALSEVQRTMKEYEGV